LAKEERNEKKECCESRKFIEMGKSKPRQEEGSYKRRCIV